MERPSPGISRIPSAASRRVPLAASSLGKRGAADAGLEDAVSTRRALLQSQARQATLERRIVELQRKLSERDEEHENQRIHIESLSNERRILLEGETRERTEAEQKEKEWEDERQAFVVKVNDLRRKARSQADSIEDLQRQYESVAYEHHALKTSSTAERDLNESRIKDLEAERDEMKKWQRRAQHLSIQLEEEKRKASESRSSEDVAADNKGDEVVRRELRRQSNNLVALQNSKDALQAEVMELRKFKKDVETTERALKDEARTLREENRSLHQQLARERHENDTLTQSFPLSSVAGEEAAALQQRLTALSTLHAETKAQLAEETAQNDQLHARITRLATESQTYALNITKRAEDAERELRWANEGRHSAEVREKLMRQELEAAQSTSHGSGAASGDQTVRIKQLEKLLSTYKSQLENMSRDSRDVESKLTLGAGFVKVSELEEAKDRTDQLEKDVVTLQETIDQLTAANTTLDGEVNDLMRRVASGEHNPDRERCLELRTNPAAKVHAVRTAQLEELRAENAALLKRLAEVDNEPSGADAAARGLVPRESFDRLAKEKADGEAAHEKRLLRLKEIFGSKSREFLESVYSLLGWRIRFDESGADIRLTSMYAPKGRMGLTIKFASHEGHFGTMQMSGGMARGLEECRDFWVTQRQSIPGFLAQVTTEMFEKTTFGRAAGYVGLD